MVPLTHAEGLHACIGLDPPRLAGDPRVLDLALRVLGPERKTADVITVQGTAEVGPAIKG